MNVSRVILGCMFPARLGPADVERIVHAAHGAGITSFDTAPLYDFHRGEELLGRALRDRRQHVEILTKAGLRWDASHGRALFNFTDASGARRVVRMDSRPEALRQEVLASCRRLGTDTLDLLQIHQPDEHTPVAQSVESLQALQSEGRIRAYGVSNYAAAQLAEACLAAAGGLASLQSEYSLLERWPERALLPLCRERRVGFLAYSPLAKGVLAVGSSAREARAQRASLGSRYDAPLARVALRSAVGRLHDIADARRVSCAQLALAWLLAQPGVSAVVVGASSVAQAEDIAGASELALGAHEVAAVGRAFARVRPWLKLSDRVQSTPLLKRVVTRVLF